MTTRQEVWMRAWVAGLTGTIGRVGEINEACIATAIANICLNDFDKRFPEAQEEERRAGREKTFPTISGCPHTVYGPVSAPPPWQMPVTCQEQPPTAWFKFVIPAQQQESSAPSVRETEAYDPKRIQ